MRLFRALMMAVLIAAGFWWYTTRAGIRYPEFHHSIEVVQAAPQTSYAPDEQRVIDIYHRVSPSVVNITSQTIQYDLLFGPVPESGQGSGFFINKDGYILTNNHVVDQARRLTVTWTPDKGHSHQYNATLVGSSRQLDLAVIKITAENLPVVTMGDSSNLQVGQDVLAIGNPFGLPGTMTRGIISSIRTVQEGDNRVYIEGAIQTDAPINPGNSGGPLLNSAGEVIGIDTMIYSETGSNVGIGFAIPINVVKTVLNQMITTGTVQAVSLGVQLYPVGPDLANQLRLPVDHGALVLGVRPGGLAERSGLRGGTEPGYIGNVPVRFGGDIITACNGQPVGDSDQLNSLLLLQKPGSTVTLSVQRGSQHLEIPVRLGNWTPN